VDTTTGPTSFLALIGPAIIIVYCYVALFRCADLCIDDGIHHPVLTVHPGADVLFFCFSSRSAFPVTNLYPGVPLFRSLP